MKKKFTVAVSGQKIPWLKLLVDIDKNLRQLKIKVLKFSQAKKTAVIETEYSKEELHETFDAIAKRNNATIEIEELQD